MSVSSRIFISYSQESETHSARVLALAQALRRDGQDADIDQFHTQEIVDWPKWCDDQIRDPGVFVLCICTAEYERRVSNKVPAEKGRGVYWEGELLREEVYDAKGNRRFIPVLFDDEPETSMPRFLRGWTRCQIRDFTLADRGYEMLLRILTNQVSVIKAPLGTTPVLPTNTGEPAAANSGPATPLPPQPQAAGTAASTPAGATPPQAAGTAASTPTGAIPPLAAGTAASTPGNAIPQPVAAQPVTPTPVAAQPTVPAPVPAPTNGAATNGAPANGAPATDNAGDCGAPLIRIAIRGKDPNLLWDKVFEWIFEQDGITTDQLQPNETFAEKELGGQRCQGFMVVCDSAAMEDGPLSPRKEIDQCMTIQLKEKRADRRPPIAVVYFPPPAEVKWARLFQNKPPKLRLILGDTPTNIGAFFNEVRALAP